MGDYRVVDLDGVGTAFLDDGSGEPVVLLHGFASNASLNWRGTGWLELQIGAGRRVIAPDLRGHGGSAKFYDPADYTTEAMAGDIVKLCAALGIGSADFVGYSMGSRIAGWIALRHHGLVRRLILGGIGETLIAGNRDAELIASALLAEAPPPPGTAANFRRFAERAGGDLPALAACMRGQEGALDPDDLRSLRVPALIAAGSLDLVAGSPEPVAQRIPGAKTFTIDGRDHMLAVGDRSFKRAVLEFLG